MKPEIKLGKYKHFKGGIVTVIGVAKNSEDYNEELVIYTHPYEGHEQMWARPIAMFLEDIEEGGYKGPRFEYIGD
jgi:hypothetical protein